MSTPDTPENSGQQEPPLVAGSSGQTAPEEAPVTRRAFLITAAATLFLLVAVILGYVCAPYMAGSLACKRMRQAGLVDPTLKVESAGPFFASASGISFSGGKLVSVSEAKGEVGYDPLTLVTGAPLDTATIEGAVVKVDLDGILTASGRSAAPLFKLPFALPRAVENLPSRSLLVRGARVDVSAGGMVRTMKVDALARNTSAGHRSAAISLTGTTGDRMMISVDGDGAKDSVSAEASFDSMGWILSCAPTLGIALPEKVGLEAAPLGVQFLVNEENGKPGKWAGVVTQSWFQYENGPLFFLVQDARAGFAGDSGHLIKGAAEGDLFVRAGGVAVGPFHPTVSVAGNGDMTLAADRVKIAGPRATMRLDDISLTANVFEESGEFTLKGGVKPSWFPAKLALSVAIPPTLDDAFVNLSLPKTKLDSVEIPTGWLPGYLDGLTLSGSIDSDIYISAGGQTAGGSSASLRLGADEGTFQLPVAGRELTVAGVRTHNARVSFLTSGTTVELPEGLRASSAQFGALALADIQVWPCRVSPEGGASVGSISASFCGGRVISGSFRGSFAKSGAFILSTPLDLSASNVDLAAVGLVLPGRPELSGSVDVSARLIQEPSVADAACLDIQASVKSPSFRFREPNSGIQVAGENLDATCEVVGAGHGIRKLRLAFSRGLGITSVEGADFSFKGRADLDGWLEISPTDVLAAVVSGPLHAAHTHLGVSFEDASATFSACGLSVDKLSGRMNVELGGDTPVIGSTQPLSAERVTLGSAVVTKVHTAFSIGDSGLSVGEFSGQFCGGTLTLSSYVKTAEGCDFALKFDGVSARSLAQLFPQFDGLLDGVLDGEFALSLKGRTLLVRSGGLTLRPTPKGRFTCRDVGAVLAGMPGLQDAARASAANTVSNMILREFSLSVTGRADAPIAVHVSGVDAAGASPVDSTVYPAGADKALEALFGGRVKVQFAAK